MISSKANESSGDTVAGTGAGSGSRWRLAVWVLVCLEVGLFLLLIPWSPLWTQNLLVGYYPALRPLYMSPYARGAISGLGLLNLGLAFWQVRNFRRLTKAVGKEKGTGNRE
ncbi:MAG: hypothetical protein A3H28_07280 [Acidobacteria bacterium RIFCSPLOWO2_02_FULL_61_28]|nr:MAG: hypothetical protein A3H28_07280 [Acidobacteria bacterium RIFCSPLOWO2_02_FULL_61_28]